MSTTNTGRPVTRILLAAGVPPLLLTAVGATLVWSWRDDLPDPVARHWGAGGFADGFSSVPAVIGMLVGAGLAMTLLGVAFGVTARDRASARVIVGVGAGAAGFVVVLMVMSTAVQRGLADAAEASFSGWWVLAAVAAGVLVGGGCQAMVPSWRTPAPDDPADGVAVAVGADERVAWSRPVTSDAMTTVVAVASIGVTVVVGVLFRQWWVLAVGAVLAVLAYALHTVRVTVDRRGVTVRGPLGWPRFHRELDEIARADVVEVNALRQFGGFGPRLAAWGEHQGTWGLVLRSGPALRLHRGDGGRELVVVDDATTAAALVNGLVQRTG